MEKTYWEIERDRNGKILSWIMILMGSIALLGESISLFKWLPTLILVNRDIIIMAMALTGLTSISALVLILGIRIYRL